MRDNTFEDWFVDEAENRDLLKSYKKLVGFRPLFNLVSI